LILNEWERADQDSSETESNAYKTSALDELSFSVFVFLGHGEWAAGAIALHVKPDEQVYLDGTGDRCEPKLLGKPMSWNP
jgi:hypothetical protein